MPVAIIPCVHEHLMCDALEALCRGYLIVADDHIWAVFECTLAALIKVFYLLHPQSSGMTGMEMEYYNCWTYLNL